MERWEKAAPGAADRFLTLLEKQTEAEIELEKRQLELEAEVARRNLSLLARGQIFGFSIGVIAIAAGAYTAISGEPLAGSFIGGAGVASLVGVFVADRWREARERETRQEK